MREQNERLRQAIERVRQQLSKQAQKLAEDQKRIADADNQIADLERQLGLKQQNSTTSRPPSSDGLAGKQRERCRRKKSKRKVGGQPGHPGAYRPLAPAERVDEIRHLLPCQCRSCGKALSQQIEEAKTDGTVRRHQVTELPQIQAHIIEYQCPGVICPECGKTTKAAIPEEASGQFGPALTELIVHMTAVCRMPRRLVERLLEQALAFSSVWEALKSAGRNPVKRWPDPAGSWSRS